MARRRPCDLRFPFPNWENAVTCGYAECFPRVRETLLAVCFPPVSGNGNRRSRPLNGQCPEGVSRVSQTPWEMSFPSVGGSKGPPAGNRNRIDRNQLPNTEVHYRALAARKARQCTR